MARCKPWARYKGRMDKHLADTIHTFRLSPVCRCRRLGVVVRPCRREACCYNR